MKLPKPVPMNPKVKDAWLKALRSGDYEQGEDWLRCNDVFCCLGVLTDLYIKEHSLHWDREPINRGYDTFSLDEVATVLPNEVIEWAGVTDCNPAVFTKKADFPSSFGEPAIHTLAELNDSHIPFSKIADCIEDSL